MIVLQHQICALYFLLQLLGHLVDVDWRVLLLLSIYYGFLLDGFFELFDMRGQLFLLSPEASERGVLLVDFLLQHADLLVQIHGLPVIN